MRLSSPFKKMGTPLARSRDVPIFLKGVPIFLPFSRSLLIQFLLVGSTAVVVLMATFGWWMARRETDIMYREIERQGRLLTTTLAIPMVNDLIYEKLGLVEEGGLIDNYVREVFARKDIDILSIAVIDTAGRVISHNDFAKYGTVLSDPFTLKAISAGTTSLARYRPGDSRFDILDIATPLSISGKRWGTLRIGISLEPVEKENRYITTRVALSTLFALVLSIIGIYFLGRRFIAPVVKLADTMEHIGAGALDTRVTVSGDNELAVLGNRFNTMMERIKRAGEELSLAQEKMARSEKLASIGTLTAGVAHEINNPLGGIFNCVRMLKLKPDLSENDLKYLDLLTEGLERIETTVNRLLWTSRKTEHEAVEVNIANAVESVRALIDYKLKKGRISFASTVPPELIAYIDLGDFRQMLLNLFINAVQAMDTGGSLAVTARREEEGSVVIEVADTGAGIDGEDLGKIFDPFFSTKPTGVGTGLGLWLTWDMIHANGGDISVASEVGKGTVFTLRLPAGADTMRADG